MHHRQTKKVYSKGFNIEDSLDLSFLKKASKELDIKAKSRVALQMIDYMNNGSPNLNLTPPIETGFLRASATAFVGSKHVGDTSDLKVQSVGGIPAKKPNPTKSHSANDDVVTVGYDTPYAASLHERKWTPGDMSRQAGNVGNKWVEKHLIADKKDIMQLYADTLREGLDDL